MEVQHSYEKPVLSEDYWDLFFGRADPEFTDLVRQTFTNTVQRLRVHGGEIEGRYVSEILEICKAFAYAATGTERKRIIKTLDTGAGKTTAVIGFIQAISQLDMRITVAVAAEKVEALCEIKRALVATGVPSEKIGILHSYRHDLDFSLESPTEGTASEASVTSDEAKEKQFLLITHSRVKKNESADGYNVYEDMERNVIIWDESFVATTPIFLSYRLLGRELAALVWEIAQELARKSTYPVTNLQELLALVQVMLDDLGEGFGKLGETGDAASEGSPEAILWNATPLPENLEKLQKSIVSLVGKNRAKPIVELLALLSESPQFRLVSTGGQHLISYEKSIPSELDNIVILNASHPIRKIEQMDSSIVPPPPYQPLKQYGDVTINYFQQNAGRDFIQKQFDTGINNNASAFCCQVVEKHVSEGESVLVFTFKDRQGQKAIASVLQDKLRKHLEDKGLDPLKVHVLTWGHETSLNKYAHCQTVILLGALHLPRASIAAQIIGQNDDIEYPLTEQQITQTQLSEQAHMMYQALSRGSCRTMNGSDASQMTAYLFHDKIEDIKNLLSVVMPEAQWEEIDPPHLGSKETLTDQIAAQIEESLQELCPERGDKVSFKRLKTNYFSDVAPQTFKNARDQVEHKSLDFGRRERSFERL